MSITIVRRRDALREIVGAWKQAGLRVGVVPTMGALHEGHLSLVRAALAACDRVVVTLFVNPRQFNSPSDLAAYPRTEETDARLLAPLGAHLLYVPDGEEIYPPGFATNVSVSGLTDGLDGTFRPGHFDGVTTVVAKLFLQTGADLAFFGEKDFQQLHVVRRMAADLDIPVRVVPCPTVREADGLALSSRNTRLSPEERALAPGLSRALFEAAHRLSRGEKPAAVLAEATARIRESGFREVDYVELRGADDLKPMDRLDRPGRLLAAAWMGEVRLIDNVSVEPPPEG